MRLKYSILWFEDNERYYDVVNEDVSEYLEELGYTPDLERRSDDSDLMEKMNEKDIDLILVDYNLKGELKGDRLVETIRNNELYTEAIFYAQNPKDLQKIGRFEGIFITHRDDLPEKTKKIIDLTIKKNQDFGNIRGLFIAETIDMAKQMEHILSQILKLEKEQYDFFITEIAQLTGITHYSKFELINGYLKSLRASLHKKYESMAPGKDRDELWEKINSISGIKTVFDTYVHEILDTRNALAHGKPSNKKGCLIWKGEEKSFDEDSCREIRKEFLKHSQNLNKISKLLEQGI